MEHGASWANKTEENGNSKQNNDATTAHLRLPPERREAALIFLGMPQAAIVLERAGPEHHQNKSLSRNSKL
jgi:hypothetical protein